jgi:hypothetical protein
VKQDYFEQLKEKFSELDSLELDDRVACINGIKRLLSEHSPFRNEPVDCVVWLKCDDVRANDYNPNKVAPPEMQLLEVSIDHDGYTQPIVTCPNDGHVEIIDGFHRSRVGKESPVVRERVKGYLPVVTIRSEQSGKNDRIASTIRHNRARGKHQIDAMSEIVLELKNRNWKNERIARELGMDEDEILRLCQISGLEEMFSDGDFSRSWEAGDSAEDFVPLDDADVSLPDRTVPNTSDPDRVFHTFDKWECHKAGFYASQKDGMTAEQCERAYAEFLSDDARFRDALGKVTSEWVHSCEHYLTNRAMNRIAWLGQAAMCYATGVPSKFCAGFNLLTQEQQDKANETALEYLNAWLANRGMATLEMSEAISEGRQVEIY